MINVIVVFRKPEDGRNIRNLLMRTGFSVAAVCTTGAQAISLFDDLKNGIVVCGYRLPDMLYTEVVAAMPDDFRMLLMAKESTLPELLGNDIVCLAMPVKVRELVETVSMMEKTLEKRIKDRKARPAARSDSDKKAIADAKALLMDRNNMTEPEAHRYLQKTAMDTGTGLTETAYMVLELFG